MKNLGIVVGVSTYLNADDLPACQRDADAAATLLQQSGRFASVLTLTSETGSAFVKSQLADFIKSNQSSDIGDVVFYFSGHGDFSGSDFSFVLSDFDESKRNKTSLSNEELDGLIRSLKPKTFIKIVDACQSGITYIKEPDSFSDYLKSSKGHFSNVYFMFSSRNDQSSYATQHISHFTKALLESVTNRPDGVIRYKDVMDDIADSFSGGDGKQTPYFVVQGDLTEELCDNSAPLRDSLVPFLSALSSPPGPQKQHVPSLSEQVQEATKNYVKKADAEKALSELASLITPKFLSTDVSALYEISVSEQSDAVPSPISIGSWIEQNPEDPAYFAKASKANRTVTKKVPKKRSAFSAFDSLRNLYAYDDDDYKEIEVIELYTSGFESTFEMPFSYIKIRLDPKYVSLSPEECYIVPIVSSTSIRIFYAFAHFKRTDFDTTVRGLTSKWATTSALLKSKDDIKGILERALKSFSDYVEEPLRKKFGPEVLAEENGTALGEDSNKTKVRPLVEKKD